MVLPAVHTQAVEPLGDANRFLFKSKGRWIVGSDWQGENPSGWAFVDSTALAPFLIQSGKRDGFWMVGEGGTWHEDREVVIRCSSWVDLPGSNGGGSAPSPPRVQVPAARGGGAPAPPKSPKAQAQAEAKGGDASTNFQVEISNSRSHSLLGTYAASGELYNAHPTFVKGQDHVLYFLGGPTQRWVIGPSAGSDNAIAFAELRGSQQGTDPSIIFAGNPSRAEDDGGGDVRWFVVLSGSWQQDHDLSAVYGPISTAPAGTSQESGYEDQERAVHRQVDDEGLRDQPGASEEARRTKVTDPPAAPATPDEDHASPPAADPEEVHEEVHEEEGGEEEEVQEEARVPSGDPEILLAFDQKLQMVCCGVMLSFGIISAAPIVSQALVCYLGGLACFLVPRFYFSPAVELLKQGIVDLRARTGECFLLDVVHTLVFDQVGLFTLQMAGAAVCLAGGLLFLARHNSLTPLFLALYHGAICWAITTTIMQEPIIHIDLQLAFSERPLFSIKTFWSTIHLVLLLLCSVRFFFGSPGAASRGPRKDMPNPQEGKQTRSHTSLLSHDLRQGSSDAVGLEDGVEDDSEGTFLR